MALPKKGSRAITVNGERFRFVGYIDHYEGENGGELIVESFEDPGQKIKARFSWEKVSRALGQVGKTIGRFDTFPPYVVRQTILHALSLGWQPQSGGGMRDLGNLDFKIDWSELRAEP